MNSSRLDLVLVLIAWWIVPNPAAAQMNGPDSIIFYNGQIITMDPRQPMAEAVAMIGNTITGVGDEGQILNRVRHPGTVVIELEGRTLMPGIIDPHTHFLGVESTRAVAEQVALSFGVTSMANTAFASGPLQELFEGIETTPLRIRLGVYLIYNTKCFGTIEPEWISRHPPDHDSDAMLRVLGIKLFADAGKPFPPFCGWPASQAELPEWVHDVTGASPFGDLVLTVEEMASVIASYQALGHQAVIHSRGDGSLDAALDAIELALDGGPNTLRHRVDHNDLVRPDQVGRYGQLGVAPVLRVNPNFLGGNTCYIEFLGGVHPLGEVVQPWARVVRSIIEANPGLPVAWHSDLGAYSPGPFQDRRTTMYDLWQLVTRNEVNPFNGSVCEAPDWLLADAPSVEQALKMMTIDAAYTIFLEDKVGSLEPGKFADLIILSENPLAVDPDDLRSIDVLMTMVGGKVEHCRPGFGRFCPEPGSPQPFPGETALNTQ